MWHVAKRKRPRKKGAARLEVAGIVDQYVFQVNVSSCQLPNVYSSFCRRRS